VHIEWAQLQNFRNYAALRFDPSPQLNVLSGANAQGKSNLLEALGFLLVGRSFRAARLPEMPAWGANGASLSCSLARGETARALRRELTQREDGGWVLSGEGSPWARAVPFSWLDLGIVAGGPSARRAFLDAFAAKLQPAHQAAIARYRQVLVRRNAILQAADGHPDRVGALDAWDEQLARLGVEILRRRLEAVDALAGHVADTFATLGGQGRVRLAYAAHRDLTPDPTAFLRALAERRSDEVRRRQSLVGPHRDDVRVEIEGREARQFASRGQQRLLALALRLGEVAPVTAAVGSAPVLLMDDPLSELDGEVRARVLAHLEGAGQVFLTTAESSLPTEEARWWEVRSGCVESPELAGAGRGGR
jgi:DNA replication and repair protein RecF